MEDITVTEEAIIMAADPAITGVLAIAATMNMEEGTTVDIAATAVLMEDRMVGDTSTKGIVS